MLDYDKILNCCLDCKKRHQGCHSECLDYKVQQHARYILQKKKEKDKMLSHYYGQRDHQFIKIGNKTKRIGKNAREL